MIDLVEQYVLFAKKLAFNKKKTVPRHVDVEELQSAAYMGLVEAASRFDASKGVAFSTFAFPRIDGAMKDYLRFLQRHPNCSLDTEDEECGSLVDTLEAKPQEEDFTEVLEVVSEDLGKTAEDMLRCYFAEDMSMKQIGERHGVSESRVSQLLSQYKNCMRQRWKNPSDFLDAVAA